MRDLKSKLVLALCAFGVSSSSVNGQVVAFSENWESITPPDTSAFGGFAFSQTGTATQTTVSSATGNPGNALEIVGDFSGVGSSTFWGAGAERAGAFTTTTSDLSQIQVSFDVLTSETAFVNVNLRNGASGNPGITKGFQNSSANVFQTHTATLDTFNVELAGFDPTSSVNLGFQFNQDWGSDTGNTVRIDNVQFTVVPEPHEYGMFAAIALGGVALCTRKRRLALAAAEK